MATGATYAIPLTTPKSGWLKRATNYCFATLTEIEYGKAELFAYFPKSLTFSGLARPNLPAAVENAKEKSIPLGGVAQPTC